QHSCGELVLRRALLRSGRLRARGARGAVGEGGGWQHHGAAGDCRYWPPSAWQHFLRGVSTVASDEELCGEYEAMARGFPFHRHDRLAVVRSRVYTHEFYKTVGG
ncbi:unnamed protein product, partial [Prorocentrum cordatum]